MKLGLIVLSAVIGLFVGSTYALASAHAAVRHAEPAIVVPADKSVSIELPEDNTLTVAPITVYGTVPHKHSAPKSFVCGGWRALEQGSGNVKECEWR